MYLIGDRLTITGLQLAGLKKTKVADESNINSVLEQVPEGTVMVIITQSLARAAEKEIEKLRRKDTFVVEIPDKSGGGEDVTKRLIREAVGFDIKT